MDLYVYTMLCKINSTGKCSMLSIPESIDSIKVGRFAFAQRFSDWQSNYNLKYLDIDLCPTLSVLTRT